MKDWRSFSPALTLVESATVGLGLFLIVLNAGLHLFSWSPATALAALSGGLASLLHLKSRATTPPQCDQRDALLLFLTSALMGGFALSWYWQRVPHDFWLDFPQQSLLLSNGLPATHPYFPDLTLGGQYGRNLLVAGLSYLSGLSLLTTLILSNVAFQVFLVIHIFLVFRRHSPKAAVYALLILTLGLGVGGWCGLLDHFFHHAALAHLLLFATQNQLQRGSPWAAVPILALGLVYPLFLCLLLPPWALSQRPNRRLVLWSAVVLVLLLAQGGPLAQMLQPKTDLSTDRASQEQSYTVVFPKDELFQLQLQPWKYWRISLGLSTLPPYAQVPDTLPRHGYHSIFSWQVLRLHWLPLWLAPFVLPLVGAEGRRWWLFGLLAYVTPSLVNFGPVYEAEYYRWELAAAIGFGSSLALALTRLKRTVWAAALLLVCCWPGLYRVTTHPWHWRWPSETSWLNHHFQELHLREGEPALCEELKKRSRPGDLVWRDSLPEPDNHRSLNADAVVIGLSGRKVVGKAFPLPGDFIGRPPFRPSLNAQAFWALGDPAAVRGAGVRWLLVDRSRDLSALAERRAESGQVALWEVRSSTEPAAGSSSHPDLEHGSPPKMITARSLQVHLLEGWTPSFDDVLTLVWQRSDPRAPWHSQPIYQSRKDGLIVSAPLQAGAYELKLSTGHVLPVQVKSLADLSRLQWLFFEKKEGGAVVTLRNAGDHPIVLREARLSLLPQNDQGVFEPAVAGLRQPSFRLEAGEQTELRLGPVKGDWPSSAGLNVESTERTRLLRLQP